MTLPPSLIDFGSGLEDLNREADAYVSGVGFTVAHIRDAVLNGMPLGKLGRDVPSWIIRDAIDAAESVVENDTDMFIWERDVYCVSDIDDSDLDVDDDRVIYGPLDKPKNWFAGQRWGELRLPRGPAKKLLRVTLLPYGFLSRPIDIPTTPQPGDPGARVRLDKDRVRFVPGKNGLLFTGGRGVPLYNLNDGETIPNGVEVVYRAGLSERELRQNGAVLRTLVMMQAAIQTFTLLQPIIGGGGGQKETVMSDGEQNSVEVAKRDVLGVLGGEIKAIKANYQHLLESVRAQDALNYVILG